MHHSSNATKESPFPEEFGVTEHFQDYTRGFLGHHSYNETILAQALPQC